MEKSPNWKKLLKTLVQVLIYFVAAYYIITRLSENWSVFDDIVYFSLPLFLSSIVIFALHPLWNALVWHFVLNDKKHKLSRLHQIDIYIRSLMLRYIPGNLFGIFSRSVFNKAYGVPFLKSFFAWCYENLTYLIIGVIFSSYIFLWGDINWLFLGYIPILVFMILGVLVGIFIVLKIDVFEAIFKKIVLPRLPETIKKETELLRPRLLKRIKIFFFYIISWLIYSTSFLVLVASLDLTLVQEYPLELISINALAWVVGYLAFITPSGVGIREGIMIYALCRFLSLEVEFAIIITLMARIVFLLGELLAFGLFSSLKYSVYKEKF